MNFKTSYLLLLIIILATAGCATKSIHFVQDPFNIPLVSATNQSITVSKVFKQTESNSNFENTKLFIKNGVGASVINFIFVNENPFRFQDRFFGDIDQSKYKLKSYTEIINGKTELKAEIYIYDFRFKRGGDLMELIDKSVNRSCGIVKIYSKIGQEIQISYGKIVDCGILSMSLANYKEYKLSDLLSDLNETAKKSFDIKKI
ncbi:MAG: hypothetical protein HRU38_24685 [Saccharospirillaceae bacterium]|nr:hypothetical protein [Saccharospirillaceae bacterium]